MSKTISYIARDFKKLRERERGELLRTAFDLFYSKINIDGDLTNQDKDYLIRQFYYKGTICCLARIDGQPLLCPYAPSSWNNEDYPVDLQLINKRNLSGIFPESMRATNMVDAVIGYIRPCKQSIYSYVESMVNKIVEVSMVMKINLFAHKMPWFAGVSPDDENKVKRLVQQLFDDEPVLFGSLNDVDKLKVVQGGTFILDKLRAEKDALWNELLTNLGINNNKNTFKKERMNKDEVNANNDEIETASSAYLTPLEQFSNDVRDVLGFNITITWKAPLGEIDNESEEEDYDNDTDE